VRQIDSNEHQQCSGFASLPCRKNFGSGGAGAVWLANAKDTTTNTTNTTSSRGDDDTLIVLFLKLR
jgi:hypothetical protein